MAIKLEDSSLALMKAEISCFKRADVMHSALRGGGGLQSAPGGQLEGQPRLRLYSRSCQFQPRGAWLPPARASAISHWKKSNPASALSNAAIGSTNYFLVSTFPVFTPTDSI